MSAVVTYLSTPKVLNFLEYKKKSPSPVKSAQLISVPAQLISVRKSNKQANVLRQNFTVIVTLIKVT